MMSRERERGEALGFQMWLLSFLSSFIYILVSAMVYGLMVHVCPFPVVLVSVFLTVGLAVIWWYGFKKHFPYYIEILTVFCVVK